MEWLLITFVIFFLWIWIFKNEHLNFQSSVTLAITVVTQPPLVWALRRHLCSLRPTAVFFHHEGWNPLWECWYLSCYLMFPKLLLWWGWILWSLLTIHQTDSFPLWIPGGTKFPQQSFMFFPLARCSYLRWPWKSCWRWQSMTLWMTCDQSLSGNLELLWIISECALHTHTHTHTTNKPAGGTCRCFALSLHQVWYSWVSSSCQRCCWITKLCPSLCNWMDCRTPVFPVLHYPPEFDEVS